MLPRLQAAEYRGGHRVWIAFEDGVEGEVDLARELFGEVFEPLKDEELFARMHFNAELGAIVWPAGADLATEFLCQEQRPECQLSGLPWTGAA